MLGFSSTRGNQLETSDSRTQNKTSKESGDIPQPENLVPSHGQQANSLSVEHHQTRVDAEKTMLSATPASQQILDAPEDKATLESSRKSDVGSIDTGSALDEDEPKEKVRQLAQQYTAQSRHVCSYNNQQRFHPEAGSPLDPASENFDFGSWTRAILKLRNEDDDHFMGRTAGLCFRNLTAYGFDNATDYQKSVGNVLIRVAGRVYSIFRKRRRKRNILQDLHGVLHAGEMLVVLGPPGSGCSTFLKTIAGETQGFLLDEASCVNYQGISWHQMHKEFRGEAIYTAEQDVHFPQLTVGDTLYFAARARAPRFIPGGMSVSQYAVHIRDVVMATLGIKHTINTKVGNEYIRGVSGGERKRVSIAEATLSGAPLQCWDNSTRGLDSANAIEFCKTLRTQTEILGITAAVSIYQAPQAAYDYFDKVIVLYEGRQIYFGDAKRAKSYFIELGFYFPNHQTEADFLTSMTSPHERIVRDGFQDKVPRTADDFVAAWKNSTDYKFLIKEIEEYERSHPLGAEDFERFKQSHRIQQAKAQRTGSPYIISYGQQVYICIWRGFKRLWAGPSLTLAAFSGNFAMAMIIGSVFYNLPETTESFYSRGVLLFFATLMSAFSSALDILVMYAQRPIVQKHTRYALYHPSAEAVASLVTDLPYKIINAITFNLALYFLANLRREPGAFFFFLLISFMLTFTMSMIFRTLATISRTLEQALVPGSLFILGLVIYTGFAIPTSYMLGWARWINYIDPVAYGFEALMINEFSGREFPCALRIPPYGLLANTVCYALGSVAGDGSVSGDAYIASAFGYNKAHKWRNFGILLAFLIFFLLLYLVAIEYTQGQKSKGERLLFRRGHIPPEPELGFADDAETLKSADDLLEEQLSNSDANVIIQKQSANFQWRNVCYDIKIKGEPRRILDHVDGFIRPGTLTALMGVSGAGKTTLLDVLASRVTMGVVTGEIVVDGKLPDNSLQRKIGYVQQQDLHLATSTVREALVFSAVLRQPAHIPRAEKIAYVEEVIKLLEMNAFADAVVGVPGEGLNVEQRKRLTIGVELVAKPELVFFLDEPTSGLDSQAAWSILTLLEKLKKNGQAILCTIHQPSGVLFQRFDRLLFIDNGGKTVYFGPIGPSCETMVDYFERNGAKSMAQNQNPAEWMFDVIGATPGCHTEIDWSQVWRNSPENQGLQDELEKINSERRKLSAKSPIHDRDRPRNFAASYFLQYWEVQKRVFEQHWRTPSYIYSKVLLCVLVPLFIGFSFFNSENTGQGLQNQMFGLFMLLTVFGQLVQQIMPLFVTQRSLYEVRERPSKTFSWQVFMLSNILAEVPWDILCATLLFLCWYYPIGLYRNAEPTNAVTERGALMWLLIVAFLIFTSTFAHMIVAGIEVAATAANLANTMFILCLTFCGVIAIPSALPRFWMFMYRVSPFSYLVGGMLSAGLSGTDIVCAENELLRFNPPPTGETCSEYMELYMYVAGGYLENPQATSDCAFCAYNGTNAFLEAVSVNPDDAWRNFGLMWVYVAFNVASALFMYWLLRIPKHNRWTRVIDRFINRIVQFTQSIGFS